MKVEMANRLANRRRAAGLSQEALAEKLGVTRQAVSKWERSESSPDTDNLIALANLYGVSLDDLLYKDVPDGEEDADRPFEDTAGKGATAVDATDAKQNSTNAADPADAASTTDSAVDGDTDTCATEPSEAASPANDCTTNAEEAAGHNAQKGDFHIGLDGIFVEDGKDHVNINWRDGVHVIDGKKGNTVHVGWDGVHVNDQDYDSLHDFHERFPQYSHGRSKSKAFRTWMHFPFPVVAVLAYLLVGLSTGAWLEGLFLIFTIPLYYVIGTFIGTRSLGALVGGLYAIGATAWFCYMAFVLDQPHPAWVILLTIPLVCALSGWAGHALRRKRQAR